MSRFVPVAQVSELAPGQMKMVVADQERLLLVNMAGTFYVISDACGHDWAPLSRGKLEGHGKRNKKVAAHIGFQGRGFGDGVY